MTTSFFPTLFSEKKHVRILLERKKTGIQFSHLPENKTLMKKMAILFNLSQHFYMNNLTK